MKGYKLIPPDWRCEGRNYSVGKTFWKKKESADVREGLLFCEEMRYCLRGRRLTPDTHMCEVEAIGDIYPSPYDDPVYYTNKLRIIREIPFRELIENIIEYRLLEEDSSRLQYVKEQTHELCLAAVQQNGMALEFVRRQTHEICKTAVEQNGMALKFVRRQTKDICFSAVNRNPRALNFVDSKTLQKKLLVEKVLADHRHWKNKDCEGWEDMRADLSGINMSDISLTGVDLSFVNLRNAHLNDVNLNKADLSHADMSCAHLRNVTMYKANLSGADMTCASLGNVYLERAHLYAANLKQAMLVTTVMPHADLSSADLGGAYLHGVDLRSVDMKNVNLSDAHIYDADLYDADLQNADLKGITVFVGATLSNAKNLPPIPMACPESGEFIGWKKANGCIVKLIIPADAKRLSAIGRKCRCDKAFVCSIRDRNSVVHDDPEEGFLVKSDRDHTFIYQVGKTVTVKNFDEDRFCECAPGIHFFMTPEEAMAYRVTLI